MGNLKNEAQNRMDYHCHILPGLDDGPAEMGESLEMARALAAAGFATVCCTPHRISGVYETTPEQVRAATRQLQAALDEAGIPLNLVPAGEYYLDEFLLEHLAEPLLLPDNLLLVEVSSRAHAQFLTETLYQVIRKGLTPLIAHPERCELFAPESAEQPVVVQKLLGLFGSAFNAGHKTRNPEREDASLLTALRALGCKFQGNLGSFAGLYGARVRRQAEYFRASGLYTHYGSDLHSIRHKGILAMRETLIP
jgi:protein-tyrosine phosphatase